MESRVLPFQKISRPIEWKIEHNLPKRLFDLIFSLILIVVLSPLFVVLSLAIRLTSKGEAIYVQPRLGRGGRVFKCYKFRTMYSDAEEGLQEILNKSPRLRHEWMKNQKLKNDPRIFPLGKWLRRTSLDELPQFWNVLKGDLSVVGPRPYMISQKRSRGPGLQNPLGQARHHRPLANFGKKPKNVSRAHCFRCRLRGKTLFLV